MLAVKSMDVTKENAEYLAKLDHSYEQLKNGDVVHKSLQELRTIINK